MSRKLEQAVEEARKRLAPSYSPAAIEELHEAERKLAAARGEPWAEPLDLGVSWSAGAPLPHLLSNGSTAVLICLAAKNDPNWDGTYTTVVSATDPEPAALLEFTFSGCQSAMLGGPNDEVLHGHPLYGRGLGAYGAYTVHNSSWIRDQEAINATHSMHRGGWHERLTHYFFGFHDEMFEAIARSVSVREVRTTLADCLGSAVQTLTAD